MPVAALTEQLVQGLLHSHGNGVDFAALLDLVARASGLKLEPEDVEVDDGLDPLPPPKKGGAPATGAPGSGAPGRIATRMRGD
jgi:hypothetical protein